MQTTLSDDGELKIEFPSVAEVRTFFKDAGQHQGFFLQLDRHLEFRHRVRARTVAPPAFDFTFEAEVVQAYPMPGGFGTGFQLCDWGPDKESALERGLKIGGRERELSEGELSPLFKIKQMNPTERFRLAMKGTRTERAILIRDNSPQVLLGLLQHPQIEIKEILEILKSNFVTGGILEHVAKNRKWMQNPEVAPLIAKNPKTSLPLAIRLLDTLRTTDLQVMAKSQGLREPLRKAALKAYTKRFSKR